MRRKIPALAHAPGEQLRADRRQLRKAERQQFKTKASFNAYLAATGQTVDDVRFRFRNNLVFEDLIKRIPGKLDDQHKAVRLDKLVRQRYEPRTSCARYYVMRDCANSRRWGVIEADP